MTRREARPTRREETSRGGGKRGGLFLGLLLGLVLGLVTAAGLAWYFNLNTGVFKTSESIPDPMASEPAQPKAPPPAEPEKTTPAALPAPEPVLKPASKENPETAAPIVERKPADTAAPPARVPLTFYGILPGDKPAKPVEPPKAKELWWLQIAALKNPGDADKLKARLTLLGLTVVTQKVESAGQILYRVRVGPYKRDEDAFADLDTLAANNYEPRLFKEPVAP